MGWCAGSEALRTYSSFVYTLPVLQRLKKEVRTTPTRTRRQRPRLKSRLTTNPSAKRLEQILTDYRDSFTYMAIALKYGVSQFSVSRYAYAAQQSRARLFGASDRG
ncbi:hypothetical protein SK1NUM_22740 [Arachnia rubra]|nr:hypothetical protein SK1NUM_22740 [Arachnia rubra]